MYWWLQGQRANYPYRKLQTDYIRSSHRNCNYGLRVMFVCQKQLKQAKKFTTIGKRKKETQSQSKLQSAKTTNNTSIEEFFVKNNLHTNPQNMSGNKIDKQTENNAEMEAAPSYRLRRHSYQQSMTGTLNAKPIKATTSVEETITEETEPGSVAERDIQADEMGSIDDLLPPKFLLKREELEKKNSSQRLDSVVDAVNKLYAMHAQVNAKLTPVEYAVFDEEGGILPQIHGIASTAKDAGDKMKLLTAEVLELREELDITKGLLHKQSKQIAALKAKQVDLIARSMSNNITIAGIDQDKPNMDTKVLVESFLEDHLEVELEDNEQIPVAHRLGPPTKGYNRPVVFSCPPSLRSRIFQNTGKLAGKNFSVNRQLPDALAEQRREIRQNIKQRQKAEEGKNEKDKSKFLVRNNRLYINGQLQRKNILPPQPKDLFVCHTERSCMEGIRMKYSDAKPAQTSSFTGAACVVDSINDVRLAYKRLFREFPDADHIVAASSVNRSQDYQDDSEFGAGYRMLQVINDHKLDNVAVFVIRHYGGEHIGPMRFSVMKEAAADALEKLG